MFHFTGIYSVSANTGTSACVYIVYTGVQHTRVLPQTYKANSKCTANRIKPIQNIHIHTYGVDGGSNERRGVKRNFAYVAVYNRYTQLRWVNI